MKYKEILTMLNKASDETLMLSRLNCHIKGLHSIVLENNEGKLTRLFITTPKHHMWKNKDVNLSLALGVHSHRYHLQLIEVHGEAMNIIYNHCNPEFGTEVDEYRFYSCDDVKYLGKAYLREYMSVPIINEYMNSNELHTVNVRKGETASWLVIEGTEYKDSTLLYTNKEVKCEKHRQFSSAKAVREYVKNYYKSFGDIKIYSI